MHRTERQFHEYQNFAILISYLVLVAAFYLVFPPSYMEKGPVQALTTVNVAKVLSYLALYTMPVILLYALINLFVRNRIIAAIIIMQLAYTAFVLFSVTTMAPVMLGNAAVQGAQMVAELEKQIQYVQIYAVSGLGLTLLFSFTSWSRYMVFLITLAQVAASAYAYFNYLR